MGRSAPETRSRRARPLPLSTTPALPAPTPSRRDPSRVGRRPSTSHAALERIALDLFAKNGFDETSIDDIATAAGIGRRTFFRYYRSKADVVWGDFAAQLEAMRVWFAAVPAGVPLMDAVHHAVIEFNRVPPEELTLHRRRLGLILGVPTLLANSTLRFVQWRDVVAEFAADRLHALAGDLLPRVIAYSALGAALAAYEQWLQDDGSDLAELLDEALGDLAAGFNHHGRDAVAEPTSPLLRGITPGPEGPQRATRRGTGRR